MYIGNLEVATLTVMYVCMYVCMYVPRYVEIDDGTYYVCVRRKKCSVTKRISVNDFRFKSRYHEPIPRLLHLQPRKALRFRKARVFYVYVFVKKRTGLFV
jgi:hypothetical protein